MNKTKHHSIEDIEAELIAQAWKEPEFRKELLENPRQALSSRGYHVPDDVVCKVLEEPEHTWMIVIPTCPTNILEFDDDAIFNLASKEAHHLHHSKDYIKEEGLWELYSHRYWPSHHEEP
ncbi:MAG: NHLP leader peptide family RiPP precursor [Parachlamydiales bacterium]|nr:NHLP leader peptide family RiPP precursor [Parachlamydiales bacterium]